MVLLLKACAKWKESHDGKAPASFKEKDEFKLFVKSMEMKPGAEVNFDEARSNAFKLW